MFGLFNKKKNEKFSVVAPVSGILTDLTDVKDPVFAEKMMGDGFAVVPEEPVVYTPISGKIASLPDSKHAIGIQNSNGVEVLIHIGLDTVNLNGKGFKAFVKEGTEVKQGDKLVEFDSEFMKENGIDTTVMVIFTLGFDKKVELIKDYGNKVVNNEILIK